jgi:hypothetical protein
MSLTRRHLAVLLTAAPVAAVAQSNATPPQPAPSPANASPGELLRKAEAEVRDISAKLAQVQVAQVTEPAFVFRP